MIIKSKTTLQILDIIGNEPGIIQSKIAIRVGLNRKTVKYHLDKLTESNLIKIIKEGRKNMVYLINALNKDEFLITNFN